MSSIDRWRARGVGPVISWWLSLLTAVVIVYLGSYLVYQWVPNNFFSATVGLGAGIMFYAFVEEHRSSNDVSSRGGQNGF